MTGYTRVFVPRPDPSGSDDWRQSAECRGLDPELFYPEKEVSGSSGERIRAVCSECAVRVECLTYAIAANETLGWWGGMSPKDRRKLRKAWEETQ